MIEALFAPFIEFGFMRRALVGSLALAIAAPPLGVFLMLRRMSLTADVLSHGALPGVALAFLFAGLSVPALWFGGLVAGLLVAVGAGALARVTGGREDATLAALYLLALGAGVALISIGGGAGDLKHILFGSVLGVDDAALLLMAGVATLTLVLLAIGWRPLVLECFDPAFAAATGAHGGFWHLVFMGLVVLNMLSAFLALGTLMAVGLMMLPAVSARLWHDTLAAQLLNASAQAALAGWAGLLLSYHFDTPSGPTIIGCAGALYFLSLLVAPGGWLPRLRNNRHRVA